MIFVYLSFSEFQGKQEREAVLSKIQKMHSMSFGNMKLQEAALHRQNSKFYTRTNFFCSAFWLWLRGKSWANLNTHFLFCQPRKAGCQNALGQREFGRITAVHLPFKSSGLGLSRQPALGLKIGIKALPQQIKWHCAATANSLLLDGFSGVLVVEV